MSSTELTHSIITDCTIHKSAKIYDHVNLFKCTIGENSKIDSYVYIEEDVVIGKNCKIRPFTFIPTGVIIGDDVFIGPNVTFTNDKYPRIDNDWKLAKTTIKDQVSVGAGVTILPGVTIGKGAMIGAGSVVTRDVLPGSTVYGNPARQINKN